MLQAEILTEVAVGCSRAQVLQLSGLSAYIKSLRLITVAGEIMDISASDGELFDAARVSVGALGVITQIRLQNRAAYKLKKREWAAPTEDILANFDELAASHRHFEIFPLVYSDYSLVLAIDESDEPIGQTIFPPAEEVSLAAVRELNANATPLQRLTRNNAVGANIQTTEAVDVSYKLLSNLRNNRFNEMESTQPVPTRSIIR